MTNPSHPFSVHEATIAGLQHALTAGEITSEQLVLLYLERIATVDTSGPQLNAVLEVNPDAIFIARALDQERSARGARGPLHGIPVLLKDNIDTGDKMHTSAGSLALANAYVPQDSFVTKQLRRAGAIILGKANMTEFANFMTEGMPSGYSSRGGQVLNPYGPGRFDPEGSSSGSAAAVAANLCAVAVGTETSGSILDPANNNGIVGIKPTVGLVSRTGIIPISMSQDTAGPLARTVADAAILLEALAGPDPADAATLACPSREAYAEYLEQDGLKGTRIGVVAGPHLERLSADERQLFEAAMAVLREQGAHLELVEVPSWANGHWRSSVLLHEFKPALNAYLSTLGPAARVRSLREIIAFNQVHPEATLKYGQTLLEAAEALSGTLTEPQYLLDRARDLRQAGPEGIDAALEGARADALLFPGAWGCDLGAKAGYPSINVPAGFTSEGHPFGITLTGRAWSEPTLIRLSYAYEQASRKRRAPAL